MLGRRGGIPGVVVVVVAQATRHNSATEGTPLAMRVLRTNTVFRDFMRTLPSTPLAHTQFAALSYVKAMAGLPGSEKLRSVRAALSSSGGRYAEYQPASQ